MTTDNSGVPGSFGMPLVTPKLTGEPACPRQKKDCEMHGTGFLNGWSMMNPGMWLFMLLFWGLIIIGIVNLIRWLTGRDNHKSQTDPETPREILKKRYARGEIERDEYEKVKKDLE